MVKEVLLIVKSLSVELDKVYDEINIGLSEGKPIKLHLSVNEIERLCEDISFNMDKVLKEDPFMKPTGFDEKKVEMELLLSLIKDKGFSIEPPDDK